MTPDDLGRLKMIKYDYILRLNPLGHETKENVKILPKILLISKLQEPITLEKRAG